MMDDEQTPVLDWDQVALAVRQMTTLQDQKKVIEPRIKELRDRLQALTKIEGTPDDKEHLRLPLPETINGIAALVVQRRVSRTLDEDKAQKILKSIVVDENPDGEPITLWDRCVEWVPVLDEDAVMAAHYEGEISVEQIDEMYPKSITEAFTLAKR